MSRLGSKVAIVTGAGGGIGGGIAAAYAREGATVAIVDVDVERAKSREVALADAGGRVMSIGLDVSDRVAVAAAVAEVVERHGRLDVLVNAAQAFAGPTRPLGWTTAVADLLDEDLDAVFDSGYRGTLYFCQEAYPHLAVRGGKVINFGSTWGQVGMARGAAYNSTKEAIRALSRTMAREWGPDGITVNVINPLVETAPLAALRRDDPARWNQIRDEIPLRRFGEPERDAGPLAVFLATADSDYITGHTFMLDGGRHMFA